MACTSNGTVMYSHFVIAATLSTASTLVSVDPGEVESSGVRGPDLALRYADHRDGLIDVFLPPGSSSGSLPLMVVVHGGFWREEWDRTHLRPLASALAAEGFVVATPEYRRVGGLGGWPQTGEDVEAVLAVVRRLVGNAARGRFDPAAPLVLAGHSAGGHLALWSGLRAGPSVVDRIVALAPVTDLVEAARLGLDDGAAQDLLGGEPCEVPDAYAAADVVRLLPGHVPVAVIHGDADQRVPVEMNRRLATELVADPGTAPFRWEELPGVDHFALIEPTSEIWPTVVRALASRPD